jgi:uncharacterized protein (DUF2062 family)
MAKQIVKRLLDKFVPDPNVIKQHKHLQFLGDRLHETNLWHLNRHSVAKAFAVGLFCAWIPLPMQMVFAAVGAIYFAANIPLSVALVWVTNPITMPPLYYFAYRVGLLFTNSPVTEQSSDFSVGNVLSELGEVWQPFLLGCLILGVISSAVGYFGIQYFWRAHITKKWAEREKRAERVEPFQCTFWRLPSKNVPSRERPFESERLINEEEV